MVTGRGWSCSLEQLLESRISLERCEVRIDAKPRRRQQVGDLDQLLQHVERLVVFADEQIDPHELVLVVRAGVLVLAERVEARAAGGLLDRFGLTAERGQRQPSE